MKFHNLAQRRGFTGTPQEKLIDVTKGFGQSNIQKQQGSTRILYDTLPLLPTTTELRFFKGSQQRDFPFSNTGSFGNKLEVAESMTITHINLMVLYWSMSEAGIKYISNILPLNLESALVGGDPSLYMVLPAELNILIGNSQVLKPIPVLQFSSEFNKEGYQLNSAVYTFNTNLVIPPLVEFEFYMKLIGNYVPIPTVVNTMIRLTIEGNASILSPRQNF